MTPAPDALASDEPIIRVAVLKKVHEVRLTSTQGATIRGDDASIGPIQASAGVLLIRDQPALSINGQGLGRAVQLELTSSDARAYLMLNGQEVAPKLSVYRDPAAGALTVVAHLPLEDYLCGVLAGEVPYARWHPEALKAQAVASRSYALNQMRARGHDAYDVEADVMSQVFKAGFRDEPALREAAGATRGLVVTCRGQLFPTYFHSTSGGHTEAVETVFTEQAPLPPLRGVSSPFSSISPVNAWTARLDKEELRQKLAAAPELGGRSVGALRGLRFIATPRSPRRAERVEVVHAQGSFELPANRFRLIAGAGVLRSVWIDRVSDAGSAFEFSGRGFGHGVGMCQYGSQGMAQQGYGYRQILGFYYPGADLTKQYGERTAMR
ncbi:MAG: SpoIID/LytB domain-containing protein [Planctomycetota bacterium]|nr:SpoIID/LytB domain-containing protein [Planctomycetota bacterium]